MKNTIKIKKNKKLEEEKKLLIDGNQKTLAYGIQLQAEYNKLAGISTPQQAPTPSQSSGGGSGGGGGGGGGGPSPLHNPLNLSVDTSHTPNSKQTSMMEQAPKTPSTNISEIKVGKGKGGYIKRFHFGTFKCAVLCDSMGNMSISLFAHTHTHTHTQIVFVFFLFPHLNFVFVWCKCIYCCLKKKVKVLRNCAIKKVTEKHIQKKIKQKNKKTGDYAIADMFTNITLAGLDELQFNEIYSKYYFRKGILNTICLSVCVFVGFFVFFLFCKLCIILYTHKKKQRETKIKKKMCNMGINRGI